MPTLAELFKRDSISATWFWVGANSVGPYGEEEKFDVVFIRDTNELSPTGYPSRRTLYVQGITTAMSQSRRKNGGEIIPGDPVDTLAYLLAEAVDADNFPAFGAWVREVRDQTSMNGLDEYEELRADFQLAKDRAAALRFWLDDSYNEYTQAVGEYRADH